MRSLEVANTIRREHPIPDLTLHQGGADERSEREERADRALALARGVIIASAPRSLIVGIRAGFRDHVREQLRRKPVGVVIDCVRSEYIDSSGLSLLFALGKEAKRGGIGYGVARLADDLRVLLNLTRIDTVIPIADTLQAAILEASIPVVAGEFDALKLATMNPESARPLLRLEP